MIKSLYIKNREIIVYIIVGVLTTMVSWGVCFVCKFFLDPNVPAENNIINSIGWLAGVVFSYPINRRWVFQSKNPKIIKEFLGFAASRVITWILDVVIMYFTVNVIGISYWIAKIFISAVLVTIVNYIFSKLLIFRKKNDSEKQINK